MNCTNIAEQIAEFTAGTLPDEQRAACQAHIDACEDCRDALHGARAMQTLRQRDTGPTPDGLFERIVDEIAAPQTPRQDARRFWLGTAFGGAVAASLLAIVMMLGLLVRPVDITPQTAEFFVSSQEPRLMHIAIEADRALPGAEISILLSGDVQIDGAGQSREFNWVDDLDAGVNKLSLPVLASGTGGGQMVVRLRHPDSEQLFVIDLKIDS